jgi:chaperonin GroES
MKHQRKSEKARSNPNLLSGEVAYDNLVIRPIVIEEELGLVKPQQYEDKPEYGEVVAVGEGRMLEDGTMVPLKSKVGDIVFFEKYSSVKVRHNGVDYLIVRDDDVRIRNIKMFK